MMKKLQKSLAILFLTVFFTFLSPYSTEISPNTYLQTGAPVTPALLTPPKADLPFLVPAGTPIGFEFSADSDDSALGMMTFYDPRTRFFGALGHSSAKNSTSSYQTTAVCAAQINSINPGSSSMVGKLSGSLKNKNFGSVFFQNNTGVYGLLAEVPPFQSAIPLASKEDVKIGTAILRTTLKGQQAQDYSVYIEDINPRITSPNHLTIRVTDPLLLTQTGGIVCGMSGSPILQNGKLIAALSHVINADPARGYAIFAETMYRSAKLLN